MEKNSYRLLYPQERTPVPNEQEADWTPEPIGTFYTTEKSLAPIKIRTPRLSYHIPIAVPTTLLWLDMVLLTLYVCLFVCFWRNSPQWSSASSFTRFQDHTQRRTTGGRTPLDEWSARRRDLYLTTHNTHNRHSCPGGIRTHNLSRRAAADLRLRSRGHWDH